MGCVVPEPIEGIATDVSLTQSRKGSAKHAKKPKSLRNSAFSATQRFLSRKAAIEAQSTQRNQNLRATPRSPRLRGFPSRKAAKPQFKNHVVIFLNNNTIPQGFKNLLI